MKRGSWQEAEALCNRDGAHLWSINSHTEWNMIYNSVGLPIEEAGLDAMSNGTVLILTSPLVFIGLLWQHKVFEFIYCNADNNINH